MLLVFGGADTLILPEIGERMASQIPDARLEIIEHAGHLVNIEAPEKFNALLCGWLARGSR